MRSCANKGGQQNQTTVFITILLLLVTILMLHNIFHAISMFPNGQVMGT